MKKTLLGILIELAAFIILIFSEKWGIPYTFALYAHIWGVYLFTKGLDLRLSEIHFTRELCFLFAFFFPIAGMAGILFYLLVLKRVDDTFLESFSYDETDIQNKEKELIANTIIEYIQLPTIPASPLRKNQLNSLFGTLAANEHEISSGSIDREQMKSDYYTVEDFEHAQDKYQNRIRKLESLCANNQSDIGQKQILANTYFEYATTLIDDPHIRKLYLHKAMHVFEEVIEATGNETFLLEKLLHIHFFLENYNAAQKLCDELLKQDSTHSAAHLRLMECLFRKKEYKRLTQAAKNARQALKPDDYVRDIADMWYRYA